MVHLTWLSVTDLNSGLSDLVVCNRSEMCGLSGLVVCDRSELCFIWFDCL